MVKAAALAVGARHMGRALPACRARAQMGALATKPTVPAREAGEAGPRRVERTECCLRALRLGPASQVTLPARPPTTEAEAEAEETAQVRVEAPEELEVADKADGTADHTDQLPEPRIPAVAAEALATPREPERQAALA